ncbi:hypothetical protein Leryth_027656 [Lithospermum erythrorhizon]|nr:hypothetical protein Leryth_027656 [Lithospermum erythrorhizon]
MESPKKKHMRELYHLVPGVNGVERRRSGYRSGNHMMLIVGVGFNGEKAFVEVLNSWGRELGNNGYCYVELDLCRSIHAIDGIVFNEDGLPLA